MDQGTGRFPDLLKRDFTVAAATGGGERIDGVILHTERGSTYTAESFTPRRHSSAAPTYRV